MLDLVDKGLVTDQMVLTVGYDVESLTNAPNFRGQITMDRYGRRVPKHAHGSVNLSCHTSSTKLIMDAVMELYDRIVDSGLLIRRINLVANHVERESLTASGTDYRQVSLFDEPEAGIDLWSFSNLIDVFQSLRGKLQGTLIIISHQERILQIAEEAAEARAAARERRRQRAVLQIRKKYGKNAILKGMNFEEGATTRDRNAQIGGHKA